MTNPIYLHGVPHSLAQDAWWLTVNPNDKDDNPPQPRVRRYQFGGPKQVRLAILLVLVLIADLLFWDYRPGISVVLFSWCLFGATALSRHSKHSTTQPALLLGLASLPFIENVQLLSAVILFTGLVISIARLQVSANQGPGWITAASVQILRSLPFSGLKSALSAVRNWRLGTNAAPQQANEVFAVFIHNWGFPLGGALILIGLLIRANPVLELTIPLLFELNLNLGTLMWRICFWSGMAMVIWPFITARAPLEPFKRKSANLQNGMGINADSVLRSLIVFNLIMAVQTVLDVSILFGGAALPEGMSHATYAHRGAYPLVVTAMLAGVFALAARPFVDSHPILKPLMFLWLGQNVFLTVSSVLRLELYIAGFGLTHLRLYALIWMAIVAIGLLMVMWQVLRNRALSWLLPRLAVLGLGTLYACSFVNFASLIAADAVARADGTHRMSEPD